MDDLRSGLAQVMASPKDGGRLEAIVVRPERDARRDLVSCRMDISLGAMGDRWGAQFDSPPLPGMPVLDSQLTLMNSRAASLIAVERSRWELAGDQLYVDLDLSEANLKAGDRLRVGEVVLEVTAKAHLGCRKFAARFGEDALAFVNSPEGKRLHLRGIYAKVVTAGEVRRGDPIGKIPQA
ncbi:MAG: hypothetical protein IT581_17570 [Verrucomicrobiales bacterium]|nr:hypothetical protein [Verrucomicrobiales bacterium]